MKPTDLVLNHFEIPLDPYPLQREEVDRLAPLQTSGWYWECGLGKTLGSTLAALYHKLQNRADQVLVLMPPILIRGWERWLNQIKGIRVLAYTGTPAQRRDMDLREQ